MQGFLLLKKDPSPAYYAAFAAVGYLLLVVLIQYTIQLAAISFRDQATREAISKNSKMRSVLGIPDAKKNQSIVAVTGFPYHGEGKVFKIFDDTEYVSALEIDKLFTDNDYTNAWHDMHVVFLPALTNDVYLYDPSPSDYQHGTYPYSVKEDENTFTPNSSFAKTFGNFTTAQRLSEQYKKMCSEADLAIFIFRGQEAAEANRTNCNKNQTYSSLAFDYASAVNSYMSINRWNNFLFHNTFMCVLIGFFGAYFCVCKISADKQPQ